MWVCYSAVPSFFLTLSAAVRIRDFFLFFFFNENRHFAELLPLQIRALQKKASEKQNKAKQSNPVTRLKQLSTLLLRLLIHPFPHWPVLFWQSSCRCVLPFPVSLAQGFCEAFRVFCISFSPALLPITLHLTFQLGKAG